MDVAQAELDLFNEKATSVKRQLEEARSSLASTRERIKDRKQSVPSVDGMEGVVLALFADCLLLTDCVYREHKQLEKSFPEKKKELARCEEELASLAAVENKLTAQLKGLRAQAEEGRSSLEAFRSRC